MQPASRLNCSLTQTSHLAAHEMTKEGDDTCCEASPIHVLPGYDWESGYCSILW